MSHLGIFSPLDIYFIQVFIKENGTTAIKNQAWHSLVCWINGTYFRTDLFDSKRQSDLLTLIAI